MKLPEIGVIACNSAASNAGALTGAAAVRLVREWGPERVGICSLPALCRGIPRQVQIVNNLRHRVVLDGCANACARSVVERLGIPWSACLNLEEDLHISKRGPFSTLEVSEAEIVRVLDALRRVVSELPGFPPDSAGG